MIEARENNEPTPSARRFSLRFRRSAYFRAAVPAAVVIGSCGLLYGGYRCLQGSAARHRSSGPTRQERASTSRRHSSGEMGSQSPLVLELEAALRGCGAQIAAPQDAASRRLVPPRHARQLAEQVAADAPAYALALKAIAERRFDDGRALLTDARREDPAESWRVTVLASVLDVYSGRYDEAVRDADAALKSRPDSAVALNQAGAAFLNAGKFSEAEHVLNRAVDQQRNVRIPGIEMADSLEMLGASMAARGRVAAADTNYRRALSIRERLSGAESPALARPLNRLATLCEMRGEPAQAETLLRRALQIETRHYGDSPEAAVCLNNLAGLYTEQRDFERAEPLFRQALAMQIKELGEQHGDTAQTLCNLAGVYAERGESEKAEALFQRALSIQLKLGGDRSADAAQTMDDLAGLYAKRGRLTAAEDFYKQELAARVAVLGENHHDTATTLNNLACLYTRMGRWSDADRLFQRCLAIHEHGQAVADPEAINAALNYATLLRDRGDLARAHSLERRAREWRALLQTDRN